MIQIRSVLVALGMSAVTLLVLFQNRVEPSVTLEAVALEDPDFAEFKGLIASNRWPEVIVFLKNKIKKSGNLSENLAQHLSQALMFLDRRQEALLLSSERRNAYGEGDKKREEWAGRVRALSEMFSSDSGFQVFQDGQNLMAERKFRLARSSFERALLLDPSHPWILTRIGQCFLLEGDHDSAYERLSMARLLNESDPYLQLWLGRSQFYRGELKEAYVLLKGSYEALMTDELAVLWYAELLSAYGKKQEAINLFNKFNKERESLAVPIKSIDSAKSFYWPAPSRCCDVGILASGEGGSPRR